MTPSWSKEQALEKVRSLMAKAEATQYEAEAALFREKADSIMQAFAIQSWQAEMGKDANEREKPEVRDFRFHSGDNLDSLMRNVFDKLAKLCRVKIGDWGYGSAKVIGFSSDLDYLDILITTVQMQVVSSLRPSAKASLSYEHNMYEMKAAGYKWQSVYENLVRVFPERFAAQRIPDEDIIERRARWEARYPQTPWEEGTDFTGYSGKANVIFTKGGYFTGEMPRNVGVRFTGEYRRFCDETGQVQIKTNPDVYARSFLEGFESMMSQRIRELTRKQEEKVTEAERTQATGDNENVGAGAGLVLRSREGDLEEFFYDLYPARRPHPKDCECDTCHFLRCNDRSCQRPRCVSYWKQVAKDEKRKPRAYRPPPERAHDSQAAQAGRRVAAEVDLSGGRNNIGAGAKGLPE